MSALLNRPAAVRAAAATATLFAALAMTALPAYGEDPSPTPSDSPTGTPSPEPSIPPSSAPPSESPPPAETPPSGSVEPIDPTASPSVDPPGDAPPADPTPVDLAVTVPGPKLTLNSTGKFIRLDVDNMGYGTAKNVRVAIDATGLNDKVEVRMPDVEYDCSPDGATALCYYPDLQPGDIDTFVELLVTPKPGATEGSAGTVKVSVTSDEPDLNPGNNSTEVQVVLVGPGTDLSAFASPVGPLKPGRSEEFYGGFYNAGSTTVEDFSVTLNLPAYASFPDEYEGCERSGEGRTLTCWAHGFPVAPGEGITIEGIMVKIARNAPGDRVLGRGVLTAQAQDEVGATAGGSYPGLRRISDKGFSAQDVEAGDNAVAFAVKTLRNPADLAIKVARAEGEKGDEVKVRFTVTNHGPSDIQGFHFTVKAPTGADIVAAPSDPEVGCTPDSGGDIDARAADCNYLHRMAAGKSVKFTMKFTVTADKVGADGRASVDYWSDGDPNLNNNTARIVIGPPGSAGGGGGGGGGLPITGASLIGLVGGGVLAVLAGGALYLVSRRRRAGDADVSGEAVA